jgi:hypothetical protein
MAYPTYREPPGDPPPPIYDTVPCLTRLDPPSAVLGSPTFTLHVHGSGFEPDAQIVWNGSPELTIVVSPEEVTTAVNMLTAVTPGPIPIAVQNGLAVSREPLTFTFEEAGAGA